MSTDYQATGSNTKALFTLKVHRGDGKALLAMNWIHGRPPKNFVGFAIEYREPTDPRFWVIKNRLSFLKDDGEVDHERKPSLASPIQLFRWVHFPLNADLKGAFTYRVTPVFMDDLNNLTHGEPQTVDIELRRWTYPDKLNVAFTRGFVSSQWFVDRYESAGPISTLLPKKADDGLRFEPTHRLHKSALAWMGFEAREVIMELLDEAIANKKAVVRMVAYDLNERYIVEKLEKLGARLMIIIDDSGSHGKAGSGENQAANQLRQSAGKENVKRQHVGNLQHNKTLVVSGPGLHQAICGSTNFSWRGLYVQANHAVVIQGEDAIAPFLTAFDNYWNNGTAGKFSKTESAEWTELGLKGIKARVAFSPHSRKNATLKAIADDISGGVKSTLFYSLAFLYQTKGPIRTAITEVWNNPRRYVYGLSDHGVGGLRLDKPDGNFGSVFPAALTENVPEPFKSEPTGGSGVRMHHKFVVIDFNKPTARVYLGSHNFSGGADTQNGENLVLVRDRRVAVSFAVEAMTMFDHYHFRVARQQEDQGERKLYLKRPPRAKGEKPWWQPFYSEKNKIRDRKLFA